MPSCSCRPAALPQRPPLTSSSRCFSLAAVSLPQRPGQQHLPDSSLPQCRHPLRHGTPCHQLRHGAPSSSSPRCPGQQYLCHCGALASNIFPIDLRCSVPASNKPHLAEKSTPVWLAIWRTWAGFANSQHRDAALAIPNNICAHSSLLPHWAAAQTDANLSTHLHRLPTPPPYLRQMRLSPGRVRGCWVLDETFASQERRC